MDPEPSSEAVAMCREIYEERYNEAPRVFACHAGLECGILGTNYPDMDMVSFGPNIRGAHTVPTNACKSARCRSFGAIS